jgi:hypothetical protein
MEQFLDDLQNVDAYAAILEDFRRINDIALHNTNLVVQAYRHAGVDFDQELASQELAVRLFLDYPDIFQYAWSRYLFYSTEAKLASYALKVPHLNVNEEQIGSLQTDLGRWFASQARGTQCNVRWDPGDNHSTLYIQRGSYLRTVPFWKDDQIEVAALRPATEDLLVYNPVQGALNIKTGLGKDREFYPGAIAHHLAGDGSLARVALGTPMFSLEPLQLGTFDYSGNGIITGVALTWIKLQLDDARPSVVAIKSEDVLDALRRRLPELSLRHNKLIAAKLQFQIHPDDGKATTVSFEIEPPVRSNLVQKRHADIIEDYLREQGVKLR